MHLASYLSNVNYVDPVMRLNPLTDMTPNVPVEFGGFLGGADFFET